MRTSLADVARAANVSTITASRAFSNPNALAPLTRSRVLEEAQKLGYIPNRLARSLRSGKTQTIAVLTTDLQQRLNTLKVDMLQHEIRRNGYHTLLLQYRAEEEGAASLFAECRDTVDGLVLCYLEGGPPSSEIHSLIEAGVAVASLEYCTGLSLDVVTVDRVHGSFLAVNRLLELGHTQIALGQIAFNSEVVGRRAYGYQGAMRAAGLTPTIISHPAGGKSAFDDGYEMMQTARRQGVQPTAWLFSDDEVAVGAMKALREWGFRLPEDVAIIGWDNAPLCNYVEPPLTSVTQPIQECVQRLVARLLERMSQPSLREEATLIPPRLVVRRSCGRSVA